MSPELVLMLDCIFLIKSIYLSHIGVLSFSIIFFLELLGQNRKHRSEVSDKTG